MEKYQSKIYKYIDRDIIIRKKVTEKVNEIIYGRK